VPSEVAGICHVAKGFRTPVSRECGDFVFIDTMWERLR